MSDQAGTGDLQFLGNEMVSYRCRKCLCLIGPDWGGYCDRDTPHPNIFVEGSTAYLNWIDGQCEDPMPENPYPPESYDGKAWETGFDDAMHYVLHGQFEEGQEE